MTDPLQAVADPPSWSIVDPETYRYFFSASAQVFAAILAIVGIAVTFKLSELQKRIADIESNLRGIAKNYQRMWGLKGDQKYFHNVAVSCGLAPYGDKVRALLDLPDNFLISEILTILDEISDSLNVLASEEGRAQAKIYKSTKENIEKAKRNILCSIKNQPKH